MEFPKNVRLARPGDEVALMALLRERHDEEEDGPFDERKVKTLVRRGVRRDYAVIGVIRGRHALEASIGLYLDPPWYNDEDTLRDFWNYVRAPYRRSTHAKTLLEFARASAVELDRQLYLKIPLNERTVHKAALLERQFGGAQGRVYCFDPAKPTPPQRIAEAVIEVAGGSKRKVHKLVREGILV